MSVTAIVPLKGLAIAKGRLSAAMAADDRRALVAWMARRVVVACRSCPGIDDVLMVAGDDAAAEVGAGAGARVVVVREQGLQVALDRADALTAGGTATLVVAADLPEVSAEDLLAVVTAAGAEGPAVVVAPTHDGGTGALLRRPPGAIRTAYGRGSAAAHVHAARRAGVPVVIVEREGLASDVDTPAQLPAALALVARSDVRCRAR